MVKLKTTTSPEYPPRTYFNVNSADLTIAFYVDPTTAGEVLTRKICGTRKPYLGLSLLNKYAQNIETIIEKCEEINPSIINIAGNGLLTIAKKVGDGVMQELVNLDIYYILSGVHSVFKIKEILSGGQTGVDFAAGVAAGALKIPCTMTFPYGYRQRIKEGIEAYSTNKEMRTIYKKQLVTLKKQINHESSNS